jgi:hypothetical protein
MNPRFLFQPTPARMSGLRLISEKTQTPISQVLRGMIDYCLQTESLDRMYPHLSGQIQSGAIQ